MELIPGSETSTHLIQTPGSHPKEYTLQTGDKFKKDILRAVISLSLSLSLPACYTSERKDKLKVKQSLYRPGQL
jgi:hypothetical protein